MNRRNFINSLLTIGAGFTILPSAGRIWKAERSLYRWFPNNPNLDIIIAWTDADIKRWNSFPIHLADEVHRKFIEKLQVRNEVPANDLIHQFTTLT